MPSYLPQLRQRPIFNNKGSNYQDIESFILKPVNQHRKESKREFGTYQDPPPETPPTPSKNAFSEEEIAESFKNDNLSSEWETTLWDQDTQETSGVENPRVHQHPHIQVQCLSILNCATIIIMPVNGQIMMCMHYQSYIDRCE